MHEVVEVIAALELPEREIRKAVDDTPIMHARHDGIVTAMAEEESAAIDRLEKSYPVSLEEPLDEEARA